MFAISIRPYDEESRNLDGHEHILVGISSAPSNSKIIRIAAKMAEVYQGNFTALYVATPGNSKISEENKKRLDENIKLADKLGAKIETVYGEEIALQMAEFAKLSGVTKIVIGNSAIKKRKFFEKISLAEQLMEYDEELEIYLIPDSRISSSYRDKKSWRYFIPKITMKDICFSIFILVLATLIGCLFDYFGYSDANIIMIYIIGVLVNSIVTAWAGYSLISSFVSVLSFNFFFTVPRFTLLASDKDYPITFLIMFLVAFLASSLTVRLKEHAKESAKAAYRTKILFDTNQLLEQVKKRDEIVDVTVRQIAKLLKRNLVLYQVEDGKLGKAETYLQDRAEVNLNTISHEFKIAQWVLTHNKHAGATTDQYSDAFYLYLAIRMNEIVYGVIGIEINQSPIDMFELSILLAILGECSLALENDRNRKEKEEAAMLAGKEQLRANLLRSISHDLRTPLTSISGNASNLISNEKYFDMDTKMQMYSDIYDDAIWLNNLVENLLSVTRLEDGRMNVHMNAEIIDEVVEEAIRHVKSVKNQHSIKYEALSELLMATMDSKLIVQVLFNLIDNAMKYTFADADIRITAQRKGDWITISVIDNGEGISDEVKEHAFEMFYTGKNEIADSRRSMGLGLALCRSIVELHGGKIEVTDNVPHGAVFRFTMKAYEPTLHEEKNR